MKRAATAGLLLFLAACSGSDSLPMAPSPGATPPLVAPPFPVGSYWVSIAGYDIAVPGIAACDKPTGEPPPSKSVTVKLTVVKEGAEWVGRIAEGPGDLALRLKDAGELQYGLRGFTGSLRGEARNTGIPGAQNPANVTVAIDDNAAIDGMTAVPFSVRALSGRATGSIRFTDSSSRSATCSAVSLTIVTDATVFTEGAIVESSVR
jgi:hypothetical protein